jgi:hypothetical protein
VPGRVVEGGGGEGGTCCRRSRRGIGPGSGPWTSGERLCVRACVCACACVRACVRVPRRRSWQDAVGGVAVHILGTKSISQSNQAHLGGGAGCLEGRQEIGVFDPCLIMD